MLTLQELLNGVKCLDENTLAELSDKLWELGTLDDIKEKVTPELFTLHICMNMVGNWQCDGWWYIICEQVKLVPFIPEALNALGLFTLKTALKRLYPVFPKIQFLLMIITILTPLIFCKITGLRYQIKN